LHKLIFKIPIFISTLFFRL